MRTFFLVRKSKFFSGVQQLNNKKGWEYFPLTLTFHPRGKTNTKQWQIILGGGGKNFNYDV